MANRTVLLTGATGFIAQHIIDNLLTKGYTVVGTARSQSRYQPVLDEFKKKYPEGKLIFEIVPDISVDDAFDEVLKKHTEVTAVLHTASPFSFGLNKSYEEAYLKPAVHGTVNILKAIQKYAPQVTNVVITSSYAAVKTGIPGHVHTHESWNPVVWETDVTNEGIAYSASKTYAEKAARDFIKNNKVNYKLATVNPPYVFGPQVFDSFVGKVLNTSNEVITAATRIDKDSTKPEVGSVAIGVDVRDVAAFHVLPLENEKVAEERLFIVAGPALAQTILNIINENIPELKGKVAVGDPSSEEKLNEENISKYDLSALYEKIGKYEFIPIKKSVIDVLQQYYKVNKHD